MTTSKGSTLYCSFCGESQHDVKKMVAGPLVYICDGCVSLCAEVIAGDKPPTTSEAELLKETRIKNLITQVEAILKQERVIYDASVIRHEPYKQLARSLEEFTELRNEYLPSVIEFPESKLKIS